MNDVPDTRDQGNQGDQGRRVPGEPAPDRHIRLFGRRVAMPRSRAMRIGVGVGFIIGGILGVLPIFGFWMLPVGLLVLSYEYATIRRMRRRGAVWWANRRGRQGRRD